LLLHLGQGVLLLLLLLVGPRSSHVITLLVSFKNGLQVAFKTTRQIIRTVLTRILLILAVRTLILAIFVYFLDLVIKFSIVDFILLKSVVWHVSAVVGRRILHRVIPL